MLRAAILSALLSTTALADTSSMNADVPGMGILENNWVRAGVNGTTGTFGSGGGTTPGLLFDPTGTGTFNPSYDYLTPGSPFDGFAVKIDGENKVNNNAGNMNQIPNCDCRMGETMFDGNNHLIWGGMWEHDGGTWEINNTYTLGETNPYVDVETEIIAGSNATTLSFGKFIDPDSQGMPGDSSSTDNVLGYGVIPETNVAFSEATVSRYALGIYTTDTNVTAGINGWSTQADGYDGTTYTDADGNPVNYGNGDDTIGISWTWTDISAGDIMEASYAYIFGPSAFDAASDAVEGGAGGGDTTTTDSWGTVEDVGSATDAASGATPDPEPRPDPEPEAPTVVDTTIETITSTSEAVSTTLPVLTASITHHTASDDGAVQTIDREKTTTVTTPVEVTTTSFDRTTETYSDSSTVVTDGTATSTVAVRNDVETTVTDPGSFTGRIDQVATAQDVVGSAVRGLSFDGVSGIGMNSKMDNGMSGSTRGFQAGGKKEGDDGLIVGAGGARIETSLEGNDDSSKATTTAIALSVGRSLEKGDAELGVRHAMTDYSFSRTIGDFSNAGETKGTDTAVSLRFTADGEKIRPVVGYTVGKRSMDGYTETGSIQSARTVADSSENYSYATVGGTLDIGMVSITALHHTDGVNDVILGIEKETDNVTWNVRAHRSMTDLGSTNAVTAGLVIKF